MKEFTPASAREAKLPVWTIVVLCTLLGIAVALLRFPFTLDDAYITFHYARNFARGYTLGTWNPGEAPVEGFTSFLWTILLGWGERLGLSPFYLSKVLGFSFAVAMPFASLGAWQASRKRQGDFPVPPALFAGAAILLSLYLPLYFYAVTGMETTFFSLQVLLMLLLPAFASSGRKIAAAMLLSVTLTLTRPEGILIVLLTQGYVLVTHRKKVPAWAMAGLVCGLIAFVGLTIYRLHAFHVPFPNTYYAKATGGSTAHRLTLGGRYLLRFLIMVAPAGLVLAVLLPARYRDVRDNPYVSGLLLVVVLYSLYVVKVGGDPDSAFPLRRHFVHVEGALALLLGGVIALSARTFRQACLTALAVALSLALWITFGWSRSYLRDGWSVNRQVGLFHLSPKKPLWVWFNRYSRPETLTAVLGAGEWPYEVPGRYIDMLGLNDSYIAHHGKVDPKSKMQDAKTDMAYVLDRQPDIIEGYMQASDLLHNACPVALHADREQMMQDLVHNPAFQQHYVFITNGPYRMMDRAVFFREAYLQRLSASELGAIPVTQLVLYTRPCA